jgi:hypothetical protein
VAFDRLDGGRVRCHRGWRRVLGVGILKAAGARRGQFLGRRAICRR